MQGYLALLVLTYELLHGEIGAINYGARGAVKATAKMQPNNWVVVKLKIRKGWHINAHNPLQKNLIATVMSGEEMGKVYYPKPEYIRLSFQRETLALYQRTVRLRGKLSSPVPSSSVSVKIKFQACDEKSCLPPEEMVLLVSEL